MSSRASTALHYLESMFSHTRCPATHCGAEVLIDGIYPHPVSRILLKYLEVSFIIMYPCRCASAIGSVESSLGSKDIFRHVGDVGGEIDISGCREKGRKLVVRCCRR